MFTLLMTTSMTSFEIIAFIANHAMFDAQGRFSDSGGILHSPTLGCSPFDCLLRRIHLRLLLGAGSSFQRGVALRGRILRVALAAEAALAVEAQRIKTSFAVAIVKPPGGIGGKLFLLR